MDNRKDPQVIEIEVSTICRGTDERPLVRSNVDKLIESLKHNDLIHPITVHASLGEYHLIAGAHRLTAFAEMGRTHILCRVFADLDAEEVELLKIDENLVRAGLTPAQQAQQMFRQQVLYELRHPEARQGGDRSKEQPANSAISFAADMAAKRNLAARTIRKDSERGRLITAEAFAEIIETKLDKGTFLDKLKSVPAVQQVEYVRQALAAAPVPEPNSPENASIAEQDEAPPYVEFENLMTDFLSRARSYDFDQMIVLSDATAMAHLHARLAAIKDFAEEMMSKSSERSTASAKAPKPASPRHFAILMESTSMRPLDVTGAWTRAYVEKMDATPAFTVTNFRPKPLSRRPDRHVKFN